MRFPTVDDVLRLNRSLFRSDEDEGDGPEVFPDLGLLEAAVMRPQQSAGGEEAYPDIHTKAAALMHSLARNHAFVDGNKRTALLAVVSFYALNAWVLAIDETEAVGLTLDVARGNIDVERIASNLKNSAFQLQPREH